MQNLSAWDQVLFERYGQGPRIPPKHSLVHLAFEAMALSQPNVLAAIHGEETITYGELDRQANHLAQILVQNGVQAGDHVGLFLVRSIPDASRNHGNAQSRRRLCSARR